MRDLYNNLLLYFQFLTRIPINKNLKCDYDNFKRGIVFFPIVGVFIGACELLIYFILKDYMSPQVLSVLIILIPVIITGGLQIDGLGDTCDGFLAFKGGGKEKVIEIMKDSRVGTFATIAVIFDFLFKYALVETAIQQNLPYIIFIAPVISRFSVVFTAYIGKRAKENGTGNLYIENVGHIGMLLVTLIVFLLGSITIGIYKIAIAMISCVIVVVIFNGYCIKKIEGQTGDTLGATNEITEIIALIVLSSISKYI